MPDALLGTLARIVIVAAAIFGNGCSRQSVPLRIGINAWPGYEFLYLAQEKGFFRDAGVEVRLVEFSSLSDCRRAYERAQLDAMGTTVVELLQVRDHSERSPQVVRVLDYSDGADVILAKKSIPSVKDLKGTRVGLETASLGVYVLARALEKNGLRIDDVKMVSIDPISMEQAFSKGELDAAVTYPPSSLKIEQSGKARGIFSSSEIQGEVVDVISVEEEVIKRRRGDVAKMLSALDRGIAYAKQNPNEAYQIMAAREGISSEEFREALTNGLAMVPASEQKAYLAPGGRLTEVIALTDRVLRKTKQINGTPRLESAVSNRFLDLDGKQLLP